MKRKSLVLILCVVFLIASVQPAFAEDLMENNYPKLVSPNKTIKGSLKNSSDEDTYSFFGNGGTYKVKLFVKDPQPMYIEYCVYNFSSPNPGWQKPEYHYEGATYDVFDPYEWTPVSDGWYTNTITIGKVKKGKKVGLGISGDSKCTYKFKIIGKKFADPKKPVIKSVKGKKHAMKVKWKKSKNAKGYLIQISRNNGWGEHYKEIRVKGSKTSKTIKKLKKGKYYVSICSYKKVRGVTAYSKWSKAKKVTVK